MKKISCVIVWLLFLQLVCFPSITINADVITSRSDLSGVIDASVLYLKNHQTISGTWGDHEKTQTADISNILENIIKISQLDDYNTINEMIELATEFYYAEGASNVDEMSRYLVLDAIFVGIYKDYMITCQNLDGGFGLDKGYTSDIIDTKLALKALADLGETEAMINAALYIASLQNADGGFSYQQGLASNPELTAEIADIFGDCIIKEQLMSYVLSDTLTALNGYLDENMPEIEDLSENNLSEVYQHFHTALYKLKTTGSYNVTPYYELQTEDGGVFDDPMATALFLELIVREQNSLIASIDHISVTNDRGYSVSSFNANENVNINVVSDYETAKAY